MERYKATQKNYIKVLNQMIEDFKDADKEHRGVWVEELNVMLNNLLGEDFFGTEGQRDPRGDQRN